MDPQGWYPDPFGVHRFRFFRDGEPTGLVMDDGVETYDEPPQPKAVLSIESEVPASTESSSLSTPSRGWYNDPLGEGLRYWDGTMWSDVAVPSHVEFEALSQLSTLVNDSRDEFHDEHQRGEGQQMETSPAPLPRPGWWQASDDRWYPPEQHPSYFASQGTALGVPSPPAPLTRRSGAPGEVETAQHVSSPWDRHTGPVPPPRPGGPFYRDPWFWVAMAAVMVCPLRRRSQG